MIKKRFFLYRGKRIVRKIAEVLEQEKVRTVLDVGAGTMDISMLVANRGYEVQGCDVVDVNTTNLSLTIYDGVNLNFKDNSFDCVMLVFVLHHMSYEDQEKLFSECVRVSKKLIIVGEDIYSNKLEWLVVRVLDFIGNRLNSKEISIPGTFRTVKMWRGFFGKFNKMRFLQSVVVKPLPYRPTRHRLFVLKVK